VRQLRLRDLGGIIVIDFIDMVLESNRDLVLRRLLECLGRDRTKHQVAEVTSLGLVQMTRKRVGQGLLEAFSEPCDVCNGRGVLMLDPLGGERKARAVGSIRRTGSENRVSDTSAAAAAAAAIHLAGHRVASAAAGPEDVDLVPELPDDAGAVADFAEPADDLAAEALAATVADGLAEAPGEPIVEPVEESVMESVTEPVMEPVASVSGPGVSEPGADGLGRRPRRATRPATTPRVDEAPV
jgi:ribonuclease E